MGETIKVHFDGLSCANCARKIEDNIKKLSCVKDANLNFALAEMEIVHDDSDKRSLIGKVAEISVRIEPGVVVREKGDVGADRHHDEIHGGEGRAVKAGRIVLFLIGVSLMASGFIIGEQFTGGYARAAVFIAAYILTGYDIVLRAVKNIFRGQVFDENFLMTVSSVGAICIGEYPEAVAVMVFYQVGEYLQNLAVGKSRKSIRELMELKADYANVVEGGATVKRDPVDVPVGSIIVVKPGERVPLDGVISKGGALIDMSSLTGESVPVRVKEGDSVLSGSINTDGVIWVETTKPFEESTVVKILEIVENASSKKAATERFITRFSRYYTPAVVGMAVLLAVALPLFTAVPIAEAVKRSLLFLVVSCPCALVISVPLTFFAGIGRASRKGILVKGSGFLQTLAAVDTVVFDKTGTITKGVFTVTRVDPENGFSESGLLKAAYSVEQFCNHPIAKSITAFYESKYGKNEFAVSDYAEIPGYGVKATVNGSCILAGNTGLLDMERIVFRSREGLGTPVYVAVDGVFAGIIVISDEIKTDSARAVRELRSLGVKNIVMLTGDRKESAEAVAGAVGITEVVGELLPDRKVMELERLYTDNPKVKILFAGDGINDAPVLARSDVGAAMGGIGSDAALEAADVVIMNDEPSKIAEAIRISRRTMRKVRHNITFALAVKFLVLLLSATGILASMWLAVFADVGVALLVILYGLL